MPMVPEIKICGITRKDEVEIVNNVNADYIGFVFAESKRRVTPGQAIILSGELKSGIRKVGVFTDTPLPEIARIARLCGLDIIQLHRDATDAEIASLPCPVWMGISIKTPECITRLQEYPSARAYVLDSHVAGMKGGTGRTFDWEWARGVSQRYDIVLAGGLNAENVGKAIDIVNPRVVDVSSGVEGENGKEEIKVKEFIKAVRNHEA
jgi:phosphoribosylanthranilate isomerase